MIKRELDSHIPCELTNHLILPYIPFADLTNEMLRLHIQRMLFYGQIEGILKLDDSLLRREVFNFDINNNQEFIYDKRDEDYHIHVCITYKVISFSKIKLIDYFAMWF